MKMPLWDSEKRHFRGKRAFAMPSRFTLMLIASSFAVNCHHFILFNKFKKYIFTFRKLHCFSWKYLGGALLLTPCI